MVGALSEHASQYTLRLLIEYGWYIYFIHHRSPRHSFRGPKVHTLAIKYREILRAIHVLIETIDRYCNHISWGSSNGWGWLPWVKHSSWRGRPPPTCSPLGQFTATVDEEECFGWRREERAAQEGLLLLLRVENRCENQVEQYWLYLNINLMYANEVVCVGELLCYAVLLIKTYWVPWLENERTDFTPTFIFNHQRDGDPFCAVKNIVCKDEGTVSHPYIAAIKVTSITYPFVI